MKKCNKCKALYSVQKAFDIWYFVCLDCGTSWSCTDQDYGRDEWQECLVEIEEKSPNLPEDKDHYAVVWRFSHGIISPVLAHKDKHGKYRDITGALLVKRGETIHTTSYIEARKIKALWHKERAEEIDRAIKNLQAAQKSHRDEIRKALREMEPKVENNKESVRKNSEELVRKILCQN